jgi:hypothetical protein
MNDRQMDDLVIEAAYEAKSQIISAAWFPLKTGNLKNSAVYTQPLSQAIGYSSAEIVFDSAVAPYIDFLEYGTEPHDIPRAFGYPLPFGIGGRFGGKFHPGSKKHVGFIGNKSVYLAFQVCLRIVGRLGKVKESS